MTGKESGTGEWNKKAGHINDIFGLAIAPRTLLLKVPGRPAPVALFNMVRYGLQNA